MFSLRVSIAKRLGPYHKSIRERYPLSSQHCGLDVLMLLQLGVASPNRFCLSIPPVLCFRGLRLHQQIHQGYMNSLSECVKCYVVHSMLVLFLLHCQVVNTCVKITLEAGLIKFQKHFLQYVVLWIICNQKSVCYLTVSVKNRASYNTL